MTAPKNITSINLKCNKNLIFKKDKIYFMFLDSD